MQPSQLGTAGVHTWGDSTVTMVTHVVEGLKRMDDIIRNMSFSFQGGNK